MGYGLGLRYRLVIDILILGAKTRIYSGEQQ